MLDKDVISLSGIQFFGRMTASISHDLKNVLAVINENAGLLEDLCFMAEKGKPLDPARLKRLAGDVKNQIRRGDRIVSSMNRFAHSADRESVVADLRELLDLLVELSSRSASMQGVSLEINRPAGSILVATSPFVLLNLLGSCLDYAMSVAGPGKKVVLAAEKAQDGALLKFGGLEGLQTPPESPFPAEPESALMRRLKAKLRVESGSREIAVILPGTAPGA